MRTPLRSLLAMLCTTALALAFLPGAGVNAQEATPEDGAIAVIDLAPGVTAEVFSGVPTDLAPGQTLYTARFVFQPGGEIPPHGHPGTTSVVVESGTLGWTLVDGTAHVIRGAASGEPTGTEDLTDPGTEVTLAPGDAIYYEDDVAHTARGAGDEPTVVWASLLLATGEPLLHEVDEATPAS